MANLSNFVFFDERSKETVSNYLANAQNATALTIQVEADGEVALKFEGMNDLLQPDKYYPLKAVGLGDFKTYDTITNAGLYMVLFDGIYRIRGELSNGLGSCKVYAVAVG